MAVAEKSDTKAKIMDVAEKAITAAGYGAFSFRDIADKIGIKSASVHYHFPTKGDLAAAVMKRYTEVFSSQLPGPDNDILDPKYMLNGFIDGFKQKIVEQQNMSLCTMLTADKALLPDRVCRELEAFYQVKLSWLTKVFMRLEDISEKEADLRACQLLASLHGASVLVQATGKIDYFEKAVAIWR